MTFVDRSDWDAFLSCYPDAHLLQTGSWGEQKAAFGWEVAHVVSGDVGAQVLFRRLPLGFSWAYVPMGPAGGNDKGCKPEAWEALWPEIDELCRGRKTVFLKVEPDLAACEAQELDCTPPPGFRQSEHSIQPRRTLVVDLSGDENSVLGRMKQKGRYNIRLALKKGVVVRPSADLELFHRLMQVTGGRDGFGVHSLAYYQRVYELFYPLGACELLLAEWEGQPLGALMVFARGSRAWYLYGASSNEHRELMPTYLLQWEAMRWARAQGCTLYDLWGVPDEDMETLEANFTQRSDRLWGVYRFKRSFGGRLCRVVGAWDRVYRPGLYAIYRWRMSRMAEGAG